MPNEDNKALSGFRGQLYFLFLVLSKDIVWLYFFLFRQIWLSHPASLCSNIFYPYC